jgi:hypothetical protein
LGGTKLFIETEGLFAGKIAFVLGRRGKEYDAAFRSITDISDGPNANVPFRAQNNLAKFAIGGSDINTMQRMCSFEYLERYFFHLLKTKTIKLGDGTSLLDAASKVPPALARHRADLATFHALHVDGAAILRQIAMRSNVDIAGASVTKKLSAKMLDGLTNSGIFAADDGPFLRGKTLEMGVAPVYNGVANSSSAKNVPITIGDNIAFSRLQALIAERGAADWTPDGIVHSKLSQGDPMLDEELDSRDGMLFNITVKGPNVTSSWSNDKHLLTQPLDKVFVVIVADVWDGVDDPWKGGNDYKNYAKDKKAKVTAPRNDAAKLAYLKAKNKKVTITNMRVRLTTSSEMVSNSAFKKGKPNTDGNVDRTSRMGLLLSGDGGVSEYIIGGWCIGTVLDNSAARSTFESGALMGAIKKQRTTNAINVSVGVEWWSADRLYRSYMNVDNTMRTRYSGLPTAKKGPMNKDLATSKAGARGKAPPPNPPPTPPTHHPQ